MKELKEVVYTVRNNITSLLSTGGGKSFNMIGQVWGLGPCPQWSQGEKLLVRGLRPREADDTFYENVLFLSRFQDRHIDICIHWLHVFNMK